MRTVVIGDVGGHAVALRDTLEGLGCDTQAGTIPAGVCIVQLGDLVHKGPESDGVLALVERFRVSGAAWVQLMGNHESQYLDSGSWFWNSSVSQDSARLLHRWWQEGFLQLAWSCPSSGIRVRRDGGQVEIIGGGDILLTHAGLSEGLWRGLGRPAGAQECADAIRVDGYERRGSDGVWQAGRMLGGGPARMDAGVLWAEDGSEIIGSWKQAGAVPGFSQAHGHTSAFSWYTGQWTEPVRSWLRTSHLGGLRLRGHVEQDRRIARLELSDGTDSALFYGCDPGHGTRPAPRWQPLELTA